jgi:hypothetical protein
MTAWLIGLLAVLAASLSGYILEHDLPSSTTTGPVTPTVDSQPILLADYIDNGGLGYLDYYPRVPTTSTGELTYEEANQQNKEKT